MSLNSSNYGSGIIIFNGERLLIFYDHCEVKFDKYEGNSEMFRNTKDGSVYLTSHRIVFINKKTNDAFKSLSMPFVSLKGVDIKQPIFGANRVEGTVLAEPNGGFNGSVHFSITFKRGGATEFGQALLEAGRRATRGGQAWAPPVNFYSIPPGATYYAAPPPAYAPPYHDPYYNFVPQHENFRQPNGSNVYMYGAPPPYPGATPYPVNNSHQNGGFPQPFLENNGKEQEAFRSSQPPAYYSVDNPHNVYMASTNYQTAPADNIASAPPAYLELDKKNA